MSDSRRPSRKPLIGHTDALARPDLLHRLQNGGAGKDEISAVRADARLRAALRHGQPGQAVGHGLAFRPCHPEAIDPAALIAGKTEVKAGEAGDRAGRPDHMNAAGRERGAEPFGVRECGDGRLHRVDHGAETSPVRGLTLRESLGERDDAHGHREPGLDRQARMVELTRRQVEAGLRQIEPGKLGRAPPDVQNQSGLRVRVKEIETAGDGQLRFLARTDDGKGQARPIPHALQEVRAIGGRPARLGGDRPQRLDPAPADLVGANL